MIAPLLQAYAQWLPKLEARDSLRRVNEIRIGTGAMDAEEQREILSAWNSAAGYEAARPKQAQVLAQLQAMGLEVVRDG